MKDEATFPIHLPESRVDDESKLGISQDLLDRDCSAFAIAGRRFVPPSSCRDASYNVIQAWTMHGDNHYLIDQWRQQCGYLELLANYKSFVRKKRPSAVLNHYV